MKIRVTKGSVKAHGTYFRKGETLHVEPEVGRKLIKQGVAERVRRNVKVKLNPNTLEDYVKAEEKTG